MKLTDHPCRLRTDGTRPLVLETTLGAIDLVAPVFMDAAADERVPIESIPGHECIPVMEAADRAVEVREVGVKAVTVFGIPESKDPEGSRAYARDGVVRGAVRAITVEADAYVITDACLCKYTDHGHCGALEDHAEDDPTLVVESGSTLDLLAETAVSHAEAGADMVAPSASMDGAVDAIRTVFDDAGHSETPITFYAVKYKSVSYGPSRDAADGAPTFGDRRHYQMDPANAREALREVVLDVKQGADVLMVRSGLPYLDIVRAIREGYDHPVAAYNVSGEYAMLHTAAEKGWLGFDGVAHESFLSMKRAGVGLIITYFAEYVARQLD